LPVRENAFENAPVRSIIIYDQHAKPAQARGRFANMTSRIVRLKAKFESEMKSAATPYFAFHPDAALHHLDESRCYGKAQTGAAVFSSGRAICLRERFKDDRLFFRWNADARVSDLKMQCDVVISQRLCLYINNDLASFSKLDGIA